MASIAEKIAKLKTKEKCTYNRIVEYIKKNYGFSVHTSYIAEVKRSLGLPMHKAPNAVTELKNPRKHPTEIQVEAIKDALHFYGLI